MSEDSTERTIKKIELRRLAACTDLWVLNLAVQYGDTRRAARDLGLHISTVATVLINQRRIRAQARSA